MELSKQESAKLDQMFDAVVKSIHDFAEKDEEPAEILKKAQ